jgi:hypothetical protein
MISVEAELIRTQTDNLRSQLKSPHFFSMTGIPKFGKNWLDNFIPDEDMQNTFLTSEVVRNVIMLQCVFYTSVYGEILGQIRRDGSRTQREGGVLGLTAGIMQKHNESSHGMPGLQESQRSKVTINEKGGEASLFKVGIIGCGQVGTMILTKLIEIQS